MADAKDPDGGSKDKPDIRPMKLPTLWDEPSTEDEASKATKVVDASIALREFREKMAAEATPALGVAYIAAMFEEETTAPPPSRRVPSVRAEASDITIQVEEASLSDEELAEIELAETEVDADRASSEAAEGSPPSAELAVTLVRACFERGEYLETICTGESVLEERPELEVVSHYVTSSRELLKAKYRDQLLESSVPRLAIAPAELAGLRIDHRAGYLLSLIDGVSSLGEIQHLCAQLSDPAALFAELLERRIVLLDVDAGDSEPP